MTFEHIDVSTEIVLTVGIPAYNAGRSLERAILSILRQTWRGTMEILVVDDGSSDDTVAIATRLFQQYGAVRVVRHERNLGRPAARNTILKESRGEYLTWMDADDEWYPDKLSVQFDALLSDSDGHAGKPVICMCAYDWKWDHSTKLSHRVPDLSGDQLKGLLSGRFGAYLWTMLARTESFRSVGSFDENLPRLQDLDFLIRFVARGGRLIVSDERRPLCAYYKTDDDKPGRVIAHSLSHIWRKHYPLFRQYGRGFCRGSRRRHLLLAARHGFNNEGWQVGTRYYVWAAIASPGWLWAPVKRWLRPVPPRKSVKLRTLRADIAAFKPTPRSFKRPGAVDVLVSLSSQHHGVLLEYLKSWDDRTRAAGLLYVPPLGEGDDHSLVLDHLGRNTPQCVDEVRRLLSRAVLSNADGGSSFVYLGVPVELDQHSISSIRTGVARTAALLQTLAELLQSTGLAALTTRLHVLVPDTETMLWRRYLRAVEAGSVSDLEEWCAWLSEADGQVLDHRAIGALCAVRGFSAVHMHLLAAGSRLSTMMSHLVELSGATADAVPAAPAVPLASPSRNQGLIAATRLLGSYADALGPDRQAQARQSLWRVPPSPVPPAASERVRACIASRCDLKPYEARFAPARALHHLGDTQSLRVNADELIYPCSDAREFETLVRDVHLLGAAAGLGSTPPFAMEGLR